MLQDRRKRFAATCIKSSYLPVRNFVNRPQMVYQISHSFHLFATDVTGLWDLSVYAVFFFEMSVGIFLRCESCPTDQTRARPIRHYCYHIWNIQQGDKNCQKIMYFVSKCLSNRNFFIPAYIPAVILVHHQKNLIQQLFHTFGISEFHEQTDICVNQVP